MGSYIVQFWLWWRQYKSRFDYGQTPSSTNPAYFKMFTHPKKMLENQFINLYSSPRFFFLHACKARYSFVQKNSYRLFWSWYKRFDNQQKAQRNSTLGSTLAQNLVCIEILNSTPFRLKIRRYFRPNIYLYPLYIALRSMFGTYLLRNGYRFEKFFFC